jgi:hypothetical protein
MTWDEFVVLVEQELINEKIPRDTPIGWISWDRNLFGGPIPAVYINQLNDADGPFLGIGED